MTLSMVKLRAFLPQGLSYQQIRHIFSKTGVWRKKINRSTLTEIENHWKEKVLSPVTSGKLADREPPQSKYILSMFPYPSGDLHMGHMRVYTVSDVLARYHRLNGCEVLHPIGWDAFGLPAENAAIDRKIAPRKWTESNIAKMKEQLNELRISFDWDRELETCSPEYYRWTQWIFLRMYQRGLAYSMTESVNWDPVDNTVLADEQIDSQGRSWRSGAKVVKRYLTQWYLRATNYTQSLLDGLDTLDPDSCRGFANAQRAWLGKPTGVRINLRVQPGNETVSVFTETPELLYGLDFLQISSSHPLVRRFTPDTSNSALLLKDMSIVHPFTDERLPLVVKDSPTLTENNNCRLGISSVFEGDQQTASALGLRVHNPVLDSQSRLQNSGKLDGSTRQEARSLCNQHLQEKKLGGWPTSSELRDWLISRQRYWGTPIPIIHCTSCGIVPVPESDLPVMLPEVKELNTEKLNPLKSQEEWINTPCPRCGGEGRRETDTFDTFVDSSWYFLRFTDPRNDSEPFSRQSANVHMPVDVYVGGAEHAILHMYYARFVNHFLCDEGLLAHREPFTLQLPLGTVHSDCYKVTETGKYLHRSRVKIEGEVVTEKSTGQPVTHTVEKMSKSKLNGVNPSDVLSQHGVDQTRLYMLANEAPRAAKNWSPQLVKKLQFAHGKQISIPKWIHVMWHTVSVMKGRRESLSPDDLIDTQTDQEVKDMVNETRNNSVRAASLHLGYTFNLHEAVHALYDNLHVIDKAPLHTKVLSAEFERCFADLLILLHPFAPHLTAELWEGLRSAPRLAVQRSSQHDWNADIFGQRWPNVDDDFSLSLQIQPARMETENSQSASQTTADNQSADSSTGSQSNEIPEHSFRTRFIALAARECHALTLPTALSLALDSGTVVPSESRLQQAEPHGPKLVVRPNWGAVLTLGEDMRIVPAQKRGVED